MHDWLVRLILKVAIPSTLEVWCRPLLHLGQLLFSWTDLNTSLNAIGSKWAGTLKVPFIENSFLSSWVTSEEVIKTLNVLTGQYLHIQLRWM